MVTTTARPLSKIMNVPNSLTIARVILTILAAVFLINGSNSLRISGGIILIVAWATDWLDGFLARRLHQISLLGALLDLVADRLLMDSISIITIVQGYWQRTQDLMPFTPYPYLVIVWAADFTLLIGLIIFTLKLKRGPLAFPPPPLLSRLAFPVQMLTLVLAVLKLGPDWLLAALMYLTIVSTLIASYVYIKKGGYVFTSR